MERRLDAYMVKRMLAKQIRKKMLTAKDKLATGHMTLKEFAALEMPEDWAQVVNEEGNDQSREATILKIEKYFEAYKKKKMPMIKVSFRPLKRRQKSVEVVLKNNSLARVINLTIEP